MPEWESAFAFTPDRPDVHLLDQHAWFILELCGDNGSSLPDIESRYLAALEVLADSRDAALDRLASGLQTLGSHGLLEPLGVA
jgi:hypothetical protein